MSKFVETVHWKEALKILKLAVTRSSTLVAPPSSSISSHSSSHLWEAHTSFAEAEVYFKKGKGGRWLNFFVLNFHPGFSPCDWWVHVRRIQTLHLLNEDSCQIFFVKWMLCDLICLKWFSNHSLWLLSWKRLFLWDIVEELSLFMTLIKDYLSGSWQPKLRIPAIQDRHPRCAWLKWRKCSLVKLFCFRVSNICCKKANSGPGMNVEFEFRPFLKHRAARQNHGVHLWPEPDAGHWTTTQVESLLLFMSPGCNLFIQKLFFLLIKRWSPCYKKHIPPRRLIFIHFHLHANFSLLLFLSSRFNLRWVSKENRTPR